MPPRFISFFFFERKSAYEFFTCLEFRRVLFRSELPPPTAGLVAASMALRLEAGQEFRAARDASYALRDMYITDPDFAVAPAEAFLDSGTMPAVRADATPRSGDT